ncbi:MAG TPA: serine/threonine-protein kinase, partial [Kofleriaceae bacterium]|nr:serine/threonine-protein kinase [Kofleriaceae bacterium]
MDDKPQTFGAYLLHEQIGSGGMASVHRAELRGADGTTKEVALKRMLPEAVVQRQLRLAFRHEARLMRYLDHPNIPKTYDAGNYRETEFISMEYIGGPTLRDVFAHSGKTVGFVPEPVALNIVAQLCDALDYAHNLRDETGKPLNIIHRDVTPSNLILSKTGVVKLIDFGLAKAQLPRSPESNAGTIKGKLNYAAPEYLDGDQLDARMDIWALGVVLWELLTSRRLFDGPTPLETLTRIRKMPIPRPSIGNPRISEGLDNIVATALQRDPEKRWQTAAQMGAAARTLIQRPESYCENRHVIEWVEWLLTLPPGTTV